MKTLVLVFSILLSVLSISAQTTSVPTQNESGWKLDKMMTFVTEAANGGLMEVQLGKYASQHAISQQVKDFGTMMVTDHSEANRKLIASVKGLQVNLPTTMDKDHQDKVNKVMEKKGADFDKEYMDMMVKDHKKDVSNFEDAQKNVSDATLKGWIDNTLPVLRQHLAKAESIQKQLK